MLFGEGLGRDTLGFEGPSVGDGFWVLMIGMIGDVGDCSWDRARAPGLRGRMTSSGDGERVDD